MNRVHTSSGQANELLSNTAQLDRTSSIVGTCQRIPYLFVKRGVLGTPADEVEMLSVHSFRENRNSIYMTHQIRW